MTFSIVDIVGGDILGDSTLGSWQFDSWCYDILRPNCWCYIGNISEHHSSLCMHTIMHTNDYIYVDIYYVWVILALVWIDWSTLPTQDVTHYILRFHLQIILSFTLSH